MANHKVKKQLFIIHNNIKLKFCICEDNILRIKRKQLAKMIETHGGICVEYSKRDDGCIILAANDNEPVSSELMILKEKYIKDCIKENTLLSIRDYILNDPNDIKFCCQNCIDFNMLADEKCEHNVKEVSTAATELKLLNEFLF